MPSSTLAVIFFATLALTTGLPSQDAFDIASQEISSLLQEGKDESACADLAKSLVDEVTSSVEASNKILETLDNGSDCPNKGQDAITAAQQNNDAAGKAAIDAASAASAAANAHVDFSSYSFSSLTEGQCAEFWENGAYVAAKQAATKAATAKTEADATAGTMDQALTSAKEEAAKQVKDCQCAARAAYNTAFATATAKAADDAAAFTKGKHMQCVLAGTAAEACDVGDVPTLKEVSLADGVPAEVCQNQESEPEPSGDPCISVKSNINGGSNMFFWVHSTTQPKCGYKHINWAAAQEWSNLGRGVFKPVDEFPNWWRSDSWSGGGKNYDIKCGEIVFSPPYEAREMANPLSLNEEERSNCKEEQME